MGRKVNIGEKSKVNIKWNVLPMDYSHEAEENIRVKFAKKYGIQLYISKSTDFADEGEQKIKKL